MLSEIKEWHAYYFRPLGNIADAPFVPQGMHRVSLLEKSDTDSMHFKVVGCKRWFNLDMFEIRDMKADW